MPRKIARKVYFKISRSTGGGVRKLKPGGTKRTKTRPARQDHLTLSAPSGNDFLKIGLGVGAAGIGIGAARGSLFGRERKSPIKEGRR